MQKRPNSSGKRADFLQYFFENYLFLLLVRWNEYRLYWGRKIQKESDTTGLVDGVAEIVIAIIIAIIGIIIIGALISVM